MKTDREILELAFEALILINHRVNTDDELLQVRQAVTLIRERLAEDDEEPFMWFGYVYRNDVPMERVQPFKLMVDDIPLYTRPAPARKPMSEDEIDDGMNEFVKWLKAQDPNIIRDPFSAAAGWAAGQKAEQEKYQELIAAAEDVIEAAERHGSVGYADRQMVNLQATVERMKE